MGRGSSPGFQLQTSLDQPDGIGGRDGCEPWEIQERRGSDRCRHIWEQHNLTVSYSQSVCAATTTKGHFTRKDQLILHNCLTTVSSWKKVQTHSINITIIYKIMLILFMWNATAKTHFLSKPNAQRHHLWVISTFRHWNLTANTEKCSATGIIADYPVWTGALKKSQLRKDKSWSRWHNCIQTSECRLEQTQHSQSGSNDSQARWSVSYQSVTTTSADTEQTAG